MEATQASIWPGRFRNEMENNGREMDSVGIRITKSKLHLATVRPEE